MRLQLKIMDKGFIEEFGLPEYKTEGSAGMDLRANIGIGTLGWDNVEKGAWLMPNKTTLIPTGISIHIGSPSYVAYLHPRSGIGHKHGIVLGNLTGVIDSDYQGEVFVSLWNRSKEPFLIKRGARIAQMVVMPVVQASFDVVETFESTERGGDGFGSTGDK